MKVNKQLMASRRMIETDKAIRRAIQHAHTQELIGLLNYAKRILAGGRL